MDGMKLIASGSGISGSEAANTHHGLTPSSGK